MQPTVTEIARDTYRISTFHEGIGIQFVQFLVVDDEPFLMHTGMRTMFESTLAGVRRVIDPSTLRWIGFSHYEADESGALEEWFAIAPKAAAVQGTVGVMVNLSDVLSRAPRMLADDEVLVTGSHRLRWLATPHLPHGWDAGFFFDESERTLFTSDLFLQFGDPEPLTEKDLVPAQREIIASAMSGPLAHDMPWTPHTFAHLLRLAALDPKTLAIMHGSSFRGDGKKAIQDLAIVLRDLLGPKA